MIDINNLMTQDQADAHTRINEIDQQIAALRAQAKALQAQDRKEKHRAEVLARREQRRAEREASRAVQAERVAEIREMMAAAGISLRDLKAALA